MDILKYFRLYPLVALLAGFCLTGHTQDHIVRAFDDSYQLENSGQYRQAAEKILQVYQADSYEMNLRLGWLTFHGGNMTESTNYYNRAISLKPYAIEPRFGLVLPLSVNGLWDEVLAQYMRILEVDPQNTLANYRVGLIYYNRGQFERAEPHLERVINLYPFDYDAMLLFAWIKFSLGKTREARVLFNKVLMHTPGDASALEGLSLIK